jgi:hypothetical protein
MSAHERRQALKSTVKAAAVSPLSFSRFGTEEPAMTVRDWTSLAGLIVSVIGFSVVIWQLTRAANAREEHQASHQAA